MPPATPVRTAWPPILPRITCWRGPMPFFQMPMISTGTGSGVEPANTVQAVACMPGLTSARGRIWGLPAWGGVRSAADTNPITARAAATSLNFMNGTPNASIMQRNGGKWKGERNCPWLELDPTLEVEIDTGLNPLNIYGEAYIIMENAGLDSNHPGYPGAGVSQAQGAGGATGLFGARSALKRSGAGSSESRAATEKASSISSDRFQGPEGDAQQRAVV